LSAGGVEDAARPIATLLHPDDPRIAQLGQDIGHILSRLPPARSSVTVKPLLLDDAPGDEAIVEKAPRGSKQLALCA
jgi:hypothetical protein